MDMISTRVNNTFRLKRNVNHRPLILGTAVYLILGFSLGGYIQPGWSISGDPNPEADLCDLSGNCLRDVTINGTRYTVTYSISSEPGGDPEAVGLLNITSSPGLKALAVDIMSNENGTFRIEIPRYVTTAMGLGRDTDFLVLADGRQIDRDIADSDELTILFVRFEKGTEQLLIGDSRIIPEFGPITIAIAAVAIVGLVAISRSTILRPRK